ncbi:hypothetical protein SAMN05660826_02097 [Caldanaerovirga acetigignens]|uniref:Uncharacterized protein n=1 Tax=Caldanaerovirga acetigignens TaxID=447595 RepID=A0A1M7M096_9FIRM|nr:hypothetical protein SAMN05660826_02097 [Caldanaerovirga acetigignens]
MKFKIVRINEILTPVSGLACVGVLLNKTGFKSRLNNAKISKMPEPDIKNSDVAISYIGLLCQGKNDFDSIEPFRQDKFFKSALGSEKSLQVRLCVRDLIWQAASGTTSYLKNWLSCLRKRE